MKTLLLLAMIAFAVARPCAAQMAVTLDRLDLTPQGVVVQGWAVQNPATQQNAPWAVVEIDGWYLNGYAPVQAVSRPDVCAVFIQYIWGHCGAVASFFSDLDWWGHVPSNQCGLVTMCGGASYVTDVGIVSLPISLDTLHGRGDVGCHYVSLWVWRPFVSDGPSGPAVESNRLPFCIGG